MKATRFSIAISLTLLVLTLALFAQPARTTAMDEAWVAGPPSPASMFPFTSAPTATVAITGTATPTLGELHVPSPAWQDQIIYFLMTDRFNDGDPANNDQGADEYDPADVRKYSGGDFQGIIDELDYIQDLGATAIWITPPVANQWWDPLVNFGGYHGYWAENFAEVDAHLGDLEEYQTLSRALHGRGMYLIQDIVANHTGNFFTYQDENGVTRYDPDDPAANVRFNTESVPVTRPSQPPFDEDNVTDPQQREEAIYHWTPTITDFKDPTQTLTYQLADLDDLNTDNPEVRATLKQSYDDWIREVGVDGFRIDTVLYVDHGFWNDFINSNDPQAPGVEAAAAETGRDDFLTFGEAFVGSDPMDDGGDRVVASYLGSEEKPELSTMLNFPMHFTINRVFAEGQPAANMAYRLEAAQALYPDPTRTLNFVDNHDVARFLSKGSVDGLKQATTFLMTAPGIPVIYYGTEQGFTEGRASMFAEGVQSGGVDHFDTSSELYQHIQAVTQLRRENPVFSRGSLTVLQANEAGPGVLAYQRDYEGETALVILNTADRPVLMVDLETGLPAGTVLKNLFGLVNQDDLTVGADGRMTLELAPREAMALLVSDETAEVSQTDVTFTVDSLQAGQVITGDLAVTGTVSVSNADLKLIVDDNLARALETTADDAGAWAATVPANYFGGGQQSHSLRVYAPDLQAVSEPYTFTTDIQIVGSGVTMFDLIGDTVGPNDVYTLPTDETFGQQMDILKTKVSAEGSDLIVDLTMAEVTDVWNPTNGFDHVLFHVFIDLPDREGATVLPRINADAPDGFAWDYLGFVEGWNNRLYASEGASADEYGTPVTPAAEISVDKESNTISLRFSSDSLGNPESLKGTKVYVTTWDWNGPESSYRGLKEIASQWTFGGGDGAVDPLIIDDTAVIPLTLDDRLIQPDPAGDDHGPAGVYELPTDETFGQQMDILQASLIPLGGELAVELQMAEVTDVWNPTNGFDHVLFHVFIDLPDREGATVLPKINADAPDGFAWDYLGFVEGWNNRLYASEGASADEYGTPVTPAAEVSVDKENNTIRLLFSNDSLGNPESLEGTKVYIATWDWNGPESSYRGLKEIAGQWNFGGGDGAVDPLIADDALIGRPAVYVPPVPPTPQVTVTFEVTVPESTPADAKLFLTGPFNGWQPGDEKFQFTRGEDGVYRFTMPVDEGTELEYRITRGSFANAEKLDPDSRFANHTLTLPMGEGELTESIEVQGWWDE